MPIRSPRRLYEIVQMQVNLDDDPAAIDLPPGQTYAGDSRPLFVKMKQGIGDYLGLTPVPYNDTRLVGVFGGNGLNTGSPYRRRVGGFRDAAYTLIAKTTFVISETYFDPITKTVVQTNKQFRTMTIGFPKGHSVKEFVDFIATCDNFDKIQGYRSPKGRRENFYMRPTG